MSDDVLNEKALAALVEAGRDPRWAEIFREMQSHVRLADYPPVPTDGIAALVAPDGVTVRVVDQHISQDDLRDAVRHDVIWRMLREQHRRLMLEGKDFLGCAQILFPKIAGIASAYKLEKLS